MNLGQSQEKSHTALQLDNSLQEITASFSTVSL